MPARNATEFLLLAGIWGASFLCMRIAAPELGPFAVALLRCGIGALTLLCILMAKGAWPALRDNLGAIGLVGVINSALPFVLLGYASLSLTAGVTSILNSLAPLWTAAIAFAWYKDVLSKIQLLGLLLGIVGVVVLVSGTGSESGNITVGMIILAFAAGVAAAAAYGFGANITRGRLTGINPLAVATGSQLAATAALLGPGLATWPDLTPRDPRLWIAVVVLGVVCTGLAYLLFFRLIASLGATRAVAVTYVIPVFGIGWGMLVLGEQITPMIVLGAVVIVAGTALTTAFGTARAPARATTRTREAPRT